MEKTHTGQPLSKFTAIKTRYGLTCTAGRPSTAPAHKPILTYVYALMKFAVWLQLFGLSAKPS